jgi:hypothetical protein
MKMFAYTGTTTCLYTCKAKRKKENQVNWTTIMRQHWTASMKMIPWRRVRSNRAYKRHAADKYHPIQQSPLPAKEKFFITAQKAIPVMAAAPLLFILYVLFFVFLLRSLVFLIFYSCAFFKFHTRSSFFCFKSFSSPCLKLITKSPLTPPKSSIHGGLGRGERPAEDFFFSSRVLRAIFLYRAVSPFHLDLPWTGAPLLSLSRATPPICVLFFLLLLVLLSLFFFSSVCLYFLFRYRCHRAKE